MKRDNDSSIHPNDSTQQPAEQTSERPSSSRGEHDYYAQLAGQAPFDGDHQPDRSEPSPGRGRGAPGSNNTRTRRLIAGVVFMLITVGVLLFAYYTFRPSNSVKVNIRTKQSGQTQDATAKPDKGPDEVTADAIA